MGPVQSREMHRGYVRAMVGGEKANLGPLAKNIVFICVKLCSNLFKSVRNVIKRKRFEMFRKRLDPFAFVIHDHPWLSMKITVNVRDELSFSLQDGLQGGKLSSGFLG